MRRASKTCVPRNCPPVDPHRIAPEPRPHRDLVEKLGVKLGDLPEERPGVVVPVKVEETLHRGRALGVGFDGGEGLGGGGGGGCQGRSQRGRGGEGEGEEGGGGDESAGSHGSSCGYLGGGEGGRV